jgi:hypothetical protein
MQDNNKFLIIDSRPYGLFSIFLHTIDNLKWAEDNNYTPVVRWDPGRRDPNLGRPSSVEAYKTNFLTDKTPPSRGNIPGHKHCQCLYWSDLGWNGSKNPWEYYFEPINDYTLEQALENSHDISDIFMAGQLDDDPRSKYLIANLHTYEPLVLWDLLEKEKNVDHINTFEYKHRKSVHDTIEKYVVVKRAISDKVEKFYKDNFTDNVLGVHVRGSDKKLEYPHKALPLQSYVDAISDYISDNPESKIYVASDNNEAIAEIFKTFGSKKVMVVNATRVNGYMSPDPICLTPATGPEHGEEVLIECLLLSKTNHLICTDSNVSAAALYMNPNMTTTYLNRKYGK